MSSPVFTGRVWARQANILTMIPEPVPYHSARKIHNHSLSLSLSHTHTAWSLNDGYCTSLFPRTRISGEDLPAGILPAEGSWAPLVWENKQSRAKQGEKPACGAATTGALGSPAGSMELS